MIAPYLSKTKLIYGWQCARRLWLEINAPDDREIFTATERLFATGHEVGGVAQTLWPGGVLIEHDDELSAALEETQDRLALPGPVTLFEATFQADGVLIRADILERDTEGKLRLVEVKASTKAKLYHSIDCAIQYWVLKQLDLEPTGIELAHINNEFVYGGNGDYQGLFTFVDLTKKVRTLLPQVSRLIEEMRATLAEGEPSIEPGRQCTDPYDCPFIGHCAPQTTDYPIAWLPGSSKVKQQLIIEGYEDIREIPSDRLSNETQEWVRAITQSGKPYLNPAAAKALEALPYPRYYLDFETVSFAVPIWKGTRPYRAYPFQWSCHIESQGGQTDHHEFLAAHDGPPPMEAFTESLIDAVGNQGPIFVYTAYEKGVIERMAKRFPQYRQPLQAIVGRLYDLHPLTKNHYYHPDMHGSWSIKAVLPTIAPDLSYADVGEITEGSAADAAFKALVNGTIPTERHEAIRRALLEYCKLDTLAMVRLAGFLSGS